MKKWLLVTLVASLAVMLTMPALAVEVDFSGQYRIRAFYNDNPTLQKDGDSKSASWLDHRFRLGTKFKLTDNLSVATRVDVLDEIPFGEKHILYDGYEENTGKDIEVDGVYLSALTSVGLFKAGRIPGGSSFGTDLGDTGIDFSFDRIEYFAKSGDLIFGAIYEKLVEDNVLGEVDTQGDCDTYYLLGVYKEENMEAGLAFRFQDVDEVSDLVDHLPLIEVVDRYSAAGTDLTPLVTSPLVGYPAGPTYYMDLRQNVGAASTLGATLAAAGAVPPGTTIAASPLAAAISEIYYSYGGLKNYAFAPYFKAVLGGVRVEAEFIYEMGEYRAKNRGFTFIDANMAPVTFGDRDINALTYKLEAAYDMDAASLKLGWASSSGQDYSELLKPNGDITIGNLLYHGLGDDFRPLLILTNDIGGQPLNNGYTTMLSGVDLLYAGASFPLNDTLTLRGALGQAWTNEDDYTGGKDDLGFEIDLGVTWKIMENLTYKGDIGYLDEGDEILAGTTLRSHAGNGDPTYAVYSEVCVNF